MARTSRFAALAATLALSTGGSAAHAATAPVCHAVGISPRFAADHTMFCAVHLVDPEGFALYRSTDSGKTWRLRSSVHPADATPTNDGTPMAVYLDDQYPAPPVVYVLLTLGLFQANDDGKTLVRLAHANLGYPDGVTMYREHLPGRPDVVSRPSFLAARGWTTVGAVGYDTVAADASSGADSTDSRTGRNVVGAPSANQRFIVPPDYADTHQAVAIGHKLEANRDAAGSTTAGIGPLGVFACAGDFVCPTPVAEFGPGTDLAGVGGVPGGLEFIVVATDPHAPGVAPGTPYLRTMVSHDYGRTWATWGAVDRLILPADVRAAHAFPIVTLAASPDAPHRLFLRINLAQGSALTLQTPAEQLFRSDDDGTSWQRVGYARGVGQPGKDRGSLPFNGSGPVGGPGYFRWIGAAAGGRLYALAGTQVSGATGKAARFSYYGLYCSADAGRHWRRGGGC
jgi:hypothetical protein